MNKIECIKYNYSLESEVQNFSSFEATIQLSDDRETIYIVNSKPKPDNIHVLEPDPFEVHKIQMIFKIQELEREKLRRNGLNIEQNSLEKRVKKLTHRMGITAMKKEIEQRMAQFEADGAPYISSAAQSFERGEH